LPVTIPSFAVFYFRPLKNRITYLIRESANNFCKLVLSAYTLIQKKRARWRYRSDIRSWAPSTKYVGLFAYAYSIRKER